MEIMPKVEEEIAVAEAPVGLQQTLFDIFELLLPKDVGHRTLGITEYDEMAQSFRQLVDIAVADREEQFNTYVYEQIAEKDAEIQRYKAEAIGLQSELEESQRQEQHYREQYELSNAHIERLTAENDRQSVLIGTKEEELSQLDEKLKSKDAHIAKLTEELAAPKAQIVLPGQSRPSQSLRDLMAATKDKQIRSAREIALSTEKPYRGKVEITPPSLNYGGSDDTDTFLGQDTPEPEQGPVLAAEVDFRAPSEVPPAYSTDGLAGDTTDALVVETFEQEIKRRVAALEMAVYGAEVA